MNSLVEEIKSRAGDRKLLITGTGRCGTKFASTVFDLPHEKTFNYDTKFTTELKPDVSAFAVPYLCLLDRDDWYVVHLVRHPQNVVGSWTTMIWISGLSFKVFLKRHYSTDDALSYYKQCIDRIDYFEADEELRVEDLGSPPIAVANSGGLKLAFQSDELTPYLERWGYNKLNKWGDDVR